MTELKKLPLDLHGHKNFSKIFLRVTFWVYIYCKLKKYFYFTILYLKFKILPLRQFSVYLGSAQPKKFFLTSNQVKRTVRPRGLTAIDIHRF